MFSESEIHKLYIDKVKLPESYFTKYETLPNCPIKMYNYNWGNHDFPRVWCTLDFSEWIKKHDISIEHLGYTCLDDPELEFIVHEKKTIVSYPTYDLHTISKHFKNEFDFFCLTKLWSIYIIHLKL